MDLEMTYIHCSQNFWGRSVNMKHLFSKGLVLSAIILMDLLAGMEFDLFVPSFPELQEAFHLSAFWVEALLSVNFVGYCLSLFLVGGLADRYGRRPIILLGLSIFLFGSILCLWSPSYEVLFAGRFLQGAGIAAPAILSFLIIADTYPLKKQQILFAMLNGLMNAAAGIAPVIGSYITLYYHWQGNFTALFLLGLLALFMTLLFIPSHKLPEHKDELSFQGYLPILYSKPLRLLIGHFVFQFVPYWIFVGLSPLLYMKDLGVSLAHFGYYQGALAFVFALGSLSFGFIVARRDQKKWLILSTHIFIASLISVALVTFFNSQSPLLITLAFLIFIIGQIIPTTILYPLCLNFIPHAKGRVSAILQGGRLLFSAFSLQVAGYFYKGSFQSMGIIILLFIVLALLTLFLVIKNKELIK